MKIVKVEGDIQVDRRFELDLAEKIVDEYQKVNSRKYGFETEAIIVDNFRCWVNQERKKECQK